MQKNICHMRLMISSQKEKLFMKPLILTWHQRIVSLKGKTDISLKLPGVYCFKGVSLNSFEGKLWWLVSSWKTECLLEFLEARLLCPPWLSIETYIFFLLGFLDVFVLHTIMVMELMSKNLITNPSGLFFLGIDLLKKIQMFWSWKMVCISWCYIHWTSVNFSSPQGECNGEEYSTEQRIQFFILFTVIVQI